jgi:hypothetical protein
MAQDQNGIALDEKVKLKHHAVLLNPLIPRRAILHGQIPCFPVILFVAVAAFPSSIITN